MNKKYFDIVFLPHNGYHLWTMGLISRELHKKGYSCCLLDLTKYHRDEGTRQRAKDFEDVPFLDYSELLNGTIDYSTIICMNDWEAIIANSRINIAKKLGKKTIGIIEGINDFLDKDIDRVRNVYKTVEYLLLTGKYDEQFFKNSKTTIVGIARLSDLLNEKTTKVEKPIALINVNFTYGVLEDKRSIWLESAIDGCKKAGIDYVITQHPSDKSDLSSYNESKEDMYTLIRNSSILISRFSSAILEALALGKPVVYHNPHLEKVEKFQEPMEAYSISFNSDELAKAIQYELSLSGNYRERANKFLDKHCNINSEKNSVILTAEAIVEITNYKNSSTGIKIGSFSDANKFYFQENYVDAMKIYLYLAEIRPSFILYKQSLNSSYLKAQESGQQVPMEIIERLKRVEQNINQNLLPDSTNDFIWNSPYKLYYTEYKEYNLSIIIPTFNRSKILEITLACLVNQKTDYKFEVIVADDGSKEDLLTITKKYEDKLDIKLVRQKDYGYQLCAVRNLGLRTAKYQFVAILDCDMAPNIYWVQSYMELLSKDDNTALIGPRKYIDTHDVKILNIINNPTYISLLPEVVTNNSISGKIANGISVDWRLEYFKETENLRLCDVPFNYFSGGNIAFAKKWLNIAGFFDEDFTNWGGEDNEFGYRLYKKGCFFRAVDGGLAYHQEPLGRENETDRVLGNKETRKIVEAKVPYFNRRLQVNEQINTNRVPLVSICIVTDNYDNLEGCVNSILNQTITDLEICIYNYNYTYSSLNILKNKYKNNERVKYRIVKDIKKAEASKLVVEMARGYYIGLLSTKDCLKSNIVEIFLNKFFNNKRLSYVYMPNFRMFPIRAWNQVEHSHNLELSKIGQVIEIDKT